MQGVITLAQRFGSKTVIAEGVESMEHFQALLAMGCELAQGYCIARPMRAEKLVDWMKEWPNLPAEPNE